MDLDFTPLEQKPTPEQVQQFKAMYPKVRSKSNIFSLIFLGALMAIVVLPLLITLITTPNAALDIIFGIMVVFIAGITGLVYAGSYYTLQRRVKLYLFALQNKLIFFINGSVSDYKGIIFGYGDSRIITEAIRTPEGIEIGEYSYTYNNGNRKTRFRMVYASIRLTRTLPNMVLDATSNNVLRFSSMPIATRNQKLSLEGDFNKYFTLYAPKDYERDALYVFTPDLMQLLIEKGAKYDMELIDDTIYIYDTLTQEISNSKELKNIMTIAEVIGKKFRDSTKRYTDERVTDGDKVVAEPGQRLKRQSGMWALIIIGLIIAIGVTVAINPQLLHYF